MQKTILTILGTNYCGSHFLSLLLGSHPEAVHAGEVRRCERPARLRRKPLCTICDDDEACPLMHGVRAAAPAKRYEVLFANAGEEVSLLVDASKKPGWAARHAGDTRYRHCYIHLMRDPRALVRRWLLSPGKSPVHERRVVFSRNPREGVRLLLARAWKVYLYKWLRQNRAITDFVQNTAGAYRVITYRSLACDTEKTVRDLTEWLGLKFHVSQLHFVDRPLHGTLKSGYPPLAPSTAPGFDLRWQRFFHPDIAAAITTDARLRDYLAEFGLTTAADGLIHGTPGTGDS